MIKQALISDNLQDVIKVIEERHLDILKLERQVLEIYELFRDLATLVDLQQESLDVIENRIMNAKDYTEKAEVELQDAENYQKKARAVSSNNTQVAIIYNLVYNMVIVSFLHIVLICCLYYVHVLLVAMLCVYSVNVVYYLFY